MNRRHFISNVLAEVLPIITFVVASELSGFLPAIKALIAVAIVSVFVSWHLERRLPIFCLVASGTILFFGLFSLVYQDPFYIIIKDTLYDLSFAIALLVGLVFQRSYLKVLFGEFVAISETGWRTLTIRWIVFFLLLALGNEIARRVLVPETWVFYKFFSVGVTWVFGFYQLRLMHREHLPEGNTFGLRITHPAPATHPSSSPEETV